RPSQSQILLSMSRSLFSYRSGAGRAGVVWPWRDVFQARFETRVAQHLEVLDQRPALVRRQRPADHAVAAATGAEFVAAVAVAGDRGIEQEAAGEAFGADAGTARIVFAAADPELRLALGNRRQQFEQVRH